MTPAEFRNYAELAGWLVIGLYLFARLVRGDREISVRIGGSKRKVKLRELAERLEKCESKHHAIDEERRGRVPAASHSWVEKTNTEVEKKLQALDERHDHLTIAVSNARRRAEEALAPAEYAEEMIDRVMRVLAWLAWRAGVKLKVDFCHGSAGNVTHRRQALAFASSFIDIGADDQPPMLLINDNHCPFPVECDAKGEEFVRDAPEVPDHASINSIDERLSETRDQIANLKRALRVHARGDERQALLSYNALGDLIGHFAAALVGDGEISKEPKEFARRFHNAIRLALRTAGESDAPHIPAKPLTNDDKLWSARLRVAAKAFGQNHLQPSDALGVETPWGLGYLSLQRPFAIWFVRPETPGPYSVVGFETDGRPYVEFEDSAVQDSQRVRHLRKIVCVGNEGELIRGELVPLSVGMENAVEVAPPTTAAKRCEHCMPGDEFVQCVAALDHNGRHSNGNRTWGMCSLCGKVETVDGEVCDRCATMVSDKENAKVTPPSMCADCGKAEPSLGGLCTACAAKQIEKEKAEHSARTVVGTATVTFDEALKRATNPPPAVMQFWEQMQEAQSLLALFDEQHQLTLYTFGVAGPGYPEDGAPVISEDGVLAARVMDYNGDRENNWWVTCEAVPNPGIARSARMFCLPVIRKIDWADREGYR
jgi:hypothetical protein